MVDIFRYGESSTAKCSKRTAMALLSVKAIERCNCTARKEEHYVTTRELKEIRAWIRRLRGIK